MKIIITRPSPDGERFAAEAAKVGAEPILSPVMAIRPRHVSIDLAGVGALAFTSANAVRVFAGMSGERSLPVFAVGKATGEAARHAGFGAVESAEGDVHSLADIIARSKRDWEILHLAGSDRAGDLSGLLLAHGARARRAVIYDAVEIIDLSPPAKAALANPDDHVAVAFFSPRSVRLFLTQARLAGVYADLRRAFALSLSPAVALAAGAAEWRRVETASAFTAEAMIALLSELVSELKGRKSPGR